MTAEASHKAQTVFRARGIQVLEVLVYGFVPDRRQNIYFSAEPTWSGTPMSFQVTGRAKKRLYFDVYLVRTTETLVKLQPAEKRHLRQAVTMAVEKLVAPLTIETTISVNKFDLNGAPQ